MGAFGEGMQENDVAVGRINEFLSGAELNGRGEAVLRGYTPLWKILKDYEYDYLYETGQKTRRSSAADWKILGVAEFFLGRGVITIGCMGIILRALERELSEFRLRTWDAPEKRRLALLEFQSRFVKKDGRWTYRAPEKNPKKSAKSKNPLEMGDSGRRVVDT